MIDITDNPEAAIILFTGYTQDWGPGTGLWRLRDKIAQRYYDRRRYLVALRTWNDSSEAAAELVRWAKPRSLYVIGYSYGCGWATTQFADALNGERAIDSLFAVDPVPRWRFAPLKVISLTRWGTYKVPANVRMAYGYRQVNGSPYGRKLEAQNGTHLHTRMVFGSHDNLKEHAAGESSYWQRTPGADHSWIDDHPSVHDDIIGLLDQAIEANKPGART